MDVLRDGVISDIPAAAAVLTGADEAWAGPGPRRCCPPMELLLLLTTEGANAATC